MRQRIKAIETIKKITHAMRLIAMSTHSKLRTKEPLLEEYQKELSALFLRLRAATPEWHNDILYPDSALPTHELVIIVGSQKGLCGTFNSMLSRLFHKTVNSIVPTTRNYIVVGKKITEYFKEDDLPFIIAQYSEFNSGNLLHISKKLIQAIMHPPQRYTHVTMISNAPKNFFVQKPHVTALIPFIQPPEEILAFTEFTWEQNPIELLDMISMRRLEATIQHLLFKSLLAEQAARFLSMDNSTRNAKQLLDAAKLHYNKLRQTKITKELTELSGSF